VYNCANVLPPFNNVEHVDARHFCFADASLLKSVQCVTPTTWTTEGEATPLQPKLISRARSHVLLVVHGKLNVCL
jgi:hypothetical protein